MVKDNSKFTIRHQDLAVELEITPQRLDEIISFFDSDPDDEWELRENDHFIYSNKKWKERIFSQHGAFAIAKYMDSIEKHSIWDRIVEFVTRHKEKIRNAFIRQKIHENCSSLVLRNNRYFLSKKDVVNIFCTSYARLNKAFEDIQKSSLPMEIYKDFEDIEGTRYYSLSGFDKLCRELTSELRSKDRKEWCGAVEIVGKKTFKLIISEQEAEKKRIQAAIVSAKKRDKNTCQITNQKPSKYDQFNMAAHHIFSVKHYPHLATSLDNLITLKEEVHKEFHVWNGGSKEPCTIDELIQFVNERYPDADQVAVRLNKIKQIFGNQKVA